MPCSTVPRLLLAGALVVGFVFVGCLNRDLAPADPHTQSGVYETISQAGSTKVDILFVVDNSNSMAEEQQVLSKQIVLMAKELITPTFVGEDTPPAVEDLHVGIVTTDMGTAGYTVMTCSNPMNGDNGVLQNHGRLEECQPSYSAADCDGGECPWLSHSTELPDDGTDPTNPPIWDDFGCIATLGTGGCGFEQQLESALVALNVQSETGPNQGFLRDDSLLAVIFVTDEDDCSASNGEIFNSSRDDFGHLNLRCAFNPGELHDIDRYYDGLVALRSHLENPEQRIVVGAIVGIPHPSDGTWRPGDSVESLRAMQIVDPGNPAGLQPSCVTEMGEAFPPVRIVELVYRFGNNGVLASICQDDWTSALQAITRKIQTKLMGRCMSRQLASADPGVCRVVETLTSEAPCPNLANRNDEERSAGWHLDLGVNDSGRRMCEILPADYNADGCPDNVSRAECEEDQFGPGSSALQGWFYDATDESCEFGQVRFTGPEITSDMSTIRFECRTALCPARRQCAGAVADPILECDALDPESCDGVCVRHNSAEVCGRDEEGRGLSCARCSTTLESFCPEIASSCAADPGRRIQNRCEVPLVREGGCCAEGFHCEMVNGQQACMPDRTTSCEG